jgi:hypothetical protein
VKGSAVKAAIATTIAIAALLVPGVARAQTIDPPVEDTFCVSVLRDTFDYIGQPDALLEAIKSGDVTITVVDDPEGCATPTSGAMTYEAWADHVGSSYQEIADIVTAMNPDRVPSFLRSVRAMNAWAKDELTALEDIQPQDCWASEYRDWRSGTQKIKDGTGALLRAFSRNNFKAATAATKVVVSGEDLLGRVNGAWDDACEG